MTCFSNVFGIHTYIQLYELSQWVKGCFHNTKPIYKSPWEIPPYIFKTLRPEQNGGHFADSIFKYISLKNIFVLIHISLNNALEGWIDSKSPLVHTMAWWLTSGNPLPEWILIKIPDTGLILGLCPANERRRYKVTPSLIGWAHT